MKKTTKSFQSLLLAFVLLCSLAISASAAYVSSTTKTITLAGRELDISSSVSTYPDSQGCQVYSTTFVLSSASSNPAGYLGAKAGLYDKDAYLIFMEGETYTSSNTPGVMAEHSTYVVDNKGTGMYVYGQGIAFAFNGSKYLSAVTNRTPNILAKRTTSSFAAVIEEQLAVATTFAEAQKISGVNEEGQAYGSALFVDSTADIPELVAAVSKDGVKGYIYSDEVYLPSTNTPEEAAAHVIRTQTIPLYDMDGTTVIGEFIINK